MFVVSSVINAQLARIVIMMKILNSVPLEKSSAKDFFLEWFKFFHFLKLKCLYNPTRLEYTSQMGKPARLEN